MTIEHTYTVGRVTPLQSMEEFSQRPWPENYDKLVAAHLAIGKLRTALERCIAPDGEAARLKHEALLES